MKLPRRIVLALATAMALAIGAPPLDAFAGKSGEGGRVYRPSRLRTPREPRPPGRRMQRAPIPEPEQRIPLRSSALIPNPEPNKRGGSGYVRRGKYFYETPKDIELKRVKGRGGYRPAVPRPEVFGTERRAKDGRRR
ncbi:MAG: hypothetical protein AB1689_28400 [Thermodesulfobacteriota bacterium]